MQNLNKQIESLYTWIDQQVKSTGTCTACGDCCDFENFGHKLFITSVEMKYFTEKMHHNLSPMTNGVCPYRVNGKCSVYDYRFAGCRIFACQRSEDLQSSTMEHALKELKQLSEALSIPYTYTDLKSVLNS